MQTFFYAGDTSKTTVIFVSDTSKTNGEGLSTLLHNTAGLTCNYWRQGSPTGASVALVSGVIGTWANGSWVSLATVGMSGYYQFGIPDAALASGADFVAFDFKGAANMPPVPNFIRLNSMVNEINTAPRLPLTWEAAFAWMVEKSLHKNETTANLDRVMKSNGTTPLASSILTDNGSTFTRGAYA